MPGTDTNIFTQDRNYAQNPNSYGNTNTNRDIWSAPDLGQFNDRTFGAILKGAGINTLNPYGTGGQWASQQESPMYWLMRARMALAPSVYGQENQPNDVGAYFNGGNLLGGSQANGQSGYDFLSNPGAGQGAARELFNPNQLSGFSNIINNGGSLTDPSMLFLKEMNDNPQLMGSALTGLLSNGMAGDAAKAMASYVQQVISQTMSNGQALQGSTPVQAVATRLGL